MNIYPVPMVLVEVSPKPLDPYLFFYRQLPVSAKILSHLMKVNQHQLWSSRQISGFQKHSRNMCAIISLPEAHRDSAHNPNKPTPFKGFEYAGGGIST